jgi:hypothetical protein
MNSSKVWTIFLLIVSLVSGGLAIANAVNRGVAIGQYRYLVAIEQTTDKAHVDEVQKGARESGTSAWACQIISLIWMAAAGFLFAKSWRPKQNKPESIHGVREVVLRVPDSLYPDIEDFAVERGVSIVGLFRWCLVVGRVVDIETSAGNRIIVRSQDGKFEKEISFEPKVGGAVPPSWLGIVR